MLHKNTVVPASPRPVKALKLWMFQREVVEGWRRVQSLLDATNRQMKERSLFFTKFFSIQGSKTQHHPFRVCEIPRLGRMWTLEIFGRPIGVPADKLINGTTSIESDKGHAATQEETPQRSSKANKILPSATIDEVRQWHSEQLGTTCCVISV
jgi:hypothetical protein